MALTKRQTLGEEIANAISHGIAALLGIAGLVLLLLRAKNLSETLTSLIFANGIILLYTMSTLYHAFKNDTAVKRLFKRFDHLSIYLLIGSTYSPIYVLVLEKPLGWILLAIQWCLIIVGIIFKAIWIKKFAGIHLAMYLILGWSGILFFGSLYNFSIPAFYLILAGGIAYTIGVLFYALHLFKYSHFVWHIFVFLGTLLHFLAIYLFLIG